MPTLQVLSDTHCERTDTKIVLPPRKAPILVLAGDIGQPWQLLIALKEAVQLWDHVLFVPGNHEFYHWEMAVAFEFFEEIFGRYPNAHLLNNDVVTIDGQRYVGSILWSTPVNCHRLNDFAQIIVSSVNDARATREQFVGWNDTAKAFLRDTVEPGDVVITHFMPLQNPDLIALGHKSQYPVDEVLDSYFGNTGLRDVFDKAALWISGHTHQAFDVTSPSGTRWVCNPLGWPCEVTGADLEGLMVEVASAAASPS